MVSALYVQAQTEDGKSQERQSHECHESWRYDDLLALSASEERSSTVVYKGLSLEKDDSKSKHREHGGIEGASDDHSCYKVMPVAQCSRRFTATSERVKSRYLWRNSTCS